MSGLTAFAPSLPAQAVAYFSDKYFPIKLVGDRNPLDTVALNPQPLPPHGGDNALHSVSRFLDDFCGTGPRHPHFPPPPRPFGLDSIHPALSGLLQNVIAR